jgi:bifunctional non-homologous end joining protein LigD
LFYYVFDLPFLDGKDLTSLTLLRRSELLKKVLPENELIRFSGAVEGKGKRLFQVASARGLVHCMVKFQQRYQMRHRKSRDEDARWGFNSAISSF